MLVAPGRAADLGQRPMAGVHQGGGLAHRPEVGVVDRDHAALVDQLGVRERLIRGAELLAEHVGVAVEHRFPLGQGPLPHPGEHRVPPLLAQLRRRQVGEARPFRFPHLVRQAQFLEERLREVGRRLGELQPGAVLGGRDEQRVHQPGLRPAGVVERRHQRLERVRVAAQDHLVEPVVGVEGAHAGHQVRLDHLPEPARFPFEQRGQDAVDGGLPGRERRVRHRHVGRVGARRQLPLGVQHAGLGHDQGLVALVVGPRAAAAPAGDQRGHQPRVAGGEPLGGEAEPGRGGGPHGGDEDVGLAEEPVEGGPVVVGVQVEFDAALAAQQSGPAGVGPQRAAVAAPR